MTNPKFEALIIMVILVNTIFQSLDMHPPLPNSFLIAVSQMNYIFTFIFTVEVLFKLVGFGVRPFARD